MRAYLPALLLLAISPASALAGTSLFYFGEVSYRAESSAREWKAFSLVKRDILPEQGKIVETVLEVEQEEGAKGEEFPVELLRIGNSSRFQLQMRFVEGELEFHGPEWSWNSWEYHMLMTLPQEEAQRRITGEGRIDSSGVLHTAKKIEIVQGANILETIRRSEALEPITAARYAELRAKFRP